MAHAELAEGIGLRLDKHAASLTSHKAPMQSVAACLHPAYVNAECVLVSWAQIAQPRVG
jgi:hypothetical protein